MPVVCSWSSCPQTVGDFPSTLQIRNLSRSTDIFGHILIFEPVVCSLFHGKITAQTYTSKICLQFCIFSHGQLLFLAIYLFSSLQSVVYSTVKSLLRHTLRKSACSSVFFLTVNVNFRLYTYFRACSLQFFPR